MITVRYTSKFRAIQNLHLNFNRIKIKVVSLKLVVKLDLKF